jgi:small subunit ribosomal protein S1
VVEVAGKSAQIELGEGIRAACVLGEKAVAGQTESAPAAKADLASLSSMLQARWKGGAEASTSKPEDIRAGQVRSFRIAKLDSSNKQIELVPA